MEASQVGSNVSITGARVSIGSSDGIGSVGQLGGSVGSFDLLDAEDSLQLDYRQAIGAASELPRQDPVRLGPVSGDFTGRREADADAVAEIDLGAQREPEQRRDTDVGSLAAEE